MIPMEENKNIWIIILVIAALLFLFSSFGMGGYGMMGLGMGYGFLFMLLFWGVLIWLIVALVSAAHSNQSEKEKDEPLTILKRRYALGEISKKEYVEMKKELEG